MSDIINSYNNRSHSSFVDCERRGVKIAFLLVTKRWFGSL